MNAYVQPVNPTIEFNFDDYECPLCTMVQSHMIMPSICMHTICSSCYQKYPNKKICPTCKANTEGTWVPNLIYARQLEKFRFECPNVKNGCNKCNLNFENHNTHLTECKYYKFCCINKECGWSGDKSEIRMHVLECEHTCVKCSKCCKNFTRKTVEDHLC